MSTLAVLEDLAFETTCAFCHAQPHVWCRTSGGSRAKDMHSARLWPIQSAYGQGYSEGRRDAKELAELAERRRA